MNFLDVTPCGQFLNRFSKDIDEGEHIPVFYWPVNLNAASIYKYSSNCHYTEA